MSTGYHSFAQVYDKFMDNIPYEEWGSYLYGLFKKYSVKEGTLIELGCGTGTLSLIMAKYGYKIIGIDNSIDMLTIAAAKTEQQSNITLLCQNMQELELGNVYDGFYCLCDSLNYLLSKEDVLRTFKKIKQYLKKGGVFIFDLKTPYFYETILGDQVFCDHQPDCSYIWENNYFKEERINQYELTFFTQKSGSELFERFTEVHHQYAFYISEIADLLSQSGLEYITAYDAFTYSSPKTESERIYIISRNGD